MPRFTGLNRQDQTLLKALFILVLLAAETECFHNNMISKWNYFLSIIKQYFDVSSLNLAYLWCQITHEPSLCANDIMKNELISEHGHLS